MGKTQNTFGSPIHQLTPEWTRIINDHLKMKIVVPEESSHYVIDQGKTADDEYKKGFVSKISFRTNPVSQADQLQRTARRYLNTQGYFYDEIVCPESGPKAQTCKDEFAKGKKSGDFHELMDGVFQSEKRELPHKKNEDISKRAKILMIALYPNEVTDTLFKRDNQKEILLLRQKLFPDVSIEILKEDLGFEE